MDLHSLEIVIKRTLQPGPVPTDHKITIESNNLALGQTEKMQTELAPTLLNWLNVEVKEEANPEAQPKA